MNLYYDSLMQRVIELAKLGKGQTHPNPMVGALIVDDEGNILAEGYHKKAGEAHAEISALKNLRAKNISPKNLTMIVNLEPCSTFGKTPPCTNAIIEAGIKKVVYGTQDLNQAECGCLKVFDDAGIELVQGILERKCRILNRFFFSGVERKSPWIIAKWAMTLDGKIASKTGDSFWITSEESRLIAQELRAEAGAVLVGSGTVLKDNPQLNYRGEKPLMQPKRIIIDHQNRIPQSARIFHSTGGSVIVVKKSKEIQSEIFKRFIQRKKTTELPEISEIRVKKEVLENNAEFLRSLLKFVCSEFIIHGLVVEGGSATLTSFFDANLVDEVNVFIAPKIIGGIDAKSALEGKGKSKMNEALLLKNVKSIPLNNDEILIQAFLNL